MFGVDFNELVVIAVVALIVIGPERLPRVARTAGHLLGRLQRYVHDVKADIDKEIRLEELKKLQADMTQNVKGLETTVSAELNSIETSLNDSIATGLEEKAAASAPDTAAAESAPDLAAALAQGSAAVPADTSAAAAPELAAGHATSATPAAPPAEPPKAA